MILAFRIGLGLLLLVGLWGFSLAISLLLTGLHAGTRSRGNAIASVLVITFGVCVIAWMAKTYVFML